MSNEKQVKITKDDLEGFCAKCGNRMNRYLETGEAPEYQERIKKVRENIEKVGFKI